MANRTTRGELKARARRVADMVNSDFISDDELNDWINLGVSELHDLLVGSFEDWFEQQATISIVSGTDAYDLPSDFYKAKGVDFDFSGSTYTVPRYMPNQRNVFKSGPAVGLLGVAAYRIIDDQIRFIPVPSGSGPATLRYVQHSTPLLTDDQRVHARIPQGWEEYIVLEAAIRMLLKEESETGPAQLHKDRLEARIRTLAERDVGEPWRVQDVTSYLSEYDDFGTGVVY